jgi:Protein of unknown function (DUF2442)
MNPRVTTVEYKSKYKLIITFENNEVKEFNLSPYLHYPVFELLNDESFCNKARVFNGTVVWDDVTDFDPDTLYLESKFLATA